MAQGSDFDKRIALISIDNAVELMVKTFLEQPRRALGFHIPRRRLEEASASFPVLLEVLEEFGGDRIQGIDLSDIEWFHRLRNQLYHGGVGLTVEEQKVVVYAQLAELLFDSLFGVEPRERPQADSVEKFLQTFNTLQLLAKSVADAEQITNGYGYQREYLVLTKRFSEYESLRRFRNDLVHSTATKSETELVDYLRKLETMVAKLKAEEGALSKGSEPPGPTSGK
jgi:hypothetical protein